MLNSVRTLGTEFGTLTPYVCVCENMRVHVFVCGYVCYCVGTCVNVCECVYICVCVCACVCVFACVCVVSLLRLRDLNGHHYKS